MEDSRLQRLVEFVQSKSPRYWIWVTLVFIVSVLLLRTILLYAIVDIKVVLHDGISQSAGVYSTGSSNNRGAVLRIGNLSLVPRDSLSITAEAGIYQTVKPLPLLPLIGFLSTDINIYKDRDVSKYSADSLGCVAYDKERDIITSYSCGKPENLVQYVRPDTGNWENKLVTAMTDGFPPIYSIKAFQNGVLGILQPPQSDMEVRDLLFYIDSTGTKQTYKLPDDLDQKYISATNVITDGNASINGNFLLSAKTEGKLYYGEINGSQVIYKDYQFPDTYDPLLDSLHCDLVGAVAYCFTGENSSHADSKIEANHRAKDSNGYIRIINFSSDKPSVKTYKLSEHIAVDGVYVTKSKNIYTYAKSESVQGDLYRITVDTDKATARMYLSSITTFAAGSGLLYVKDNALYKFDDSSNESYLVFKSKHLRISNIMQFGDETFINAFIEGVPSSKLHTYKLLSTSSSLANGKRLVDLLPIYINSQLLDIDYMDNTIRVRVFTPSTVDKQHNQLLYDEGQYEYNRNSIETELNSLGISSNKYQIIYSK